MSTADRERREELANGGVASRDGDLVTLGNGVQWWLNGAPWARDEADGLVVLDRALVAQTRYDLARSCARPRDVIVTRYE